MHAHKWGVFFLACVFLSGETFVVCGATIKVRHGSFQLTSGVQPNGMPPSFKITCAMTCLQTHQCRAFETTLDSQQKFICNPFETTKITTISGALFSRIYAAPTASACWEPKPDHNVVYGLLGIPGQDNRPKIFYFGSTTVEDTCRQWCGMEPLCLAYTLHNGLVGGYSNTCYGRGPGSPETMVAEPGMKSGNKLC